MPSEREKPKYLLRRRRYLRSISLFNLTIRTVIQWERVTLKELRGEILLNLQPYVNEFQSKLARLRPYPIKTKMVVTRPLQTDNLRWRVKNLPGAYYEPLRRRTDVNRMGNK